MAGTTDRSGDKQSGSRWHFGTRGAAVALVLLAALAWYPLRAGAVVTYVGKRGECLCTVAGCTGCVINTNQLIPAGHSIIVTCSTKDGSVPTVTDSGGAYANDSFSANTNGVAGIIRSRLKIAADLPANSAITIANMASNAGSGCVADEYSGIDSKDVVGQNNQTNLNPNTPTSLSVSTAAPTTQAKAGVVAAFACQKADFAARPFTATSPYVATGAAGTTGLALNRSVWGAWQQLNATGAQTANGMLVGTGNVDCANVIAAYKAILPTSTCGGAANPWQPITVTPQGGLASAPDNYTITTRVPNDPGRGCDLTTDTVITIVLPAGTGLGGVTATFNGTPVTLTVTGTTITFKAPTPLSFNQAVTIVLNSVTNPTAGTKTLTMSASPTEQGAIGDTSATYVISDPCTSPWQPISVEVVAPNTSPGSVATYNISTAVPTSPTCKLTTSSLITIKFPAGTGMTITSGTLNGTGVVFNPPIGTNVSFSSPIAVAAGTVVTITLNGVTNPGAGSKTLAMNATPTLAGSIPDTTSGAYEIVGAPRLCFPQKTGVPYDSDPPTMNGSEFINTFASKVDKDTGWTHGFRYTLSNGTPNADGAIQAIQSNSDNAIYLSFQMKNDVVYDNDDAIVIAFNPDGTEPNMRRFIIYPLTSPNGATDANAAITNPIKYWTGHNATGWLNMQTNPPGVITGLARSTAAPGTWDVQVKIDRSAAGINLPATGDFGMYVNMVRVNSTTSTNTQFTWPPSTPLVANAAIEGDSLPAPGLWGIASLTTGCSGVNVSYSDVTSNHGGFIHSTQPNQFNVVVHNSGTVEAKNVNATFQIADFGLPAPQQWVNPGTNFNNPMAGNPTGTANVPAGGTTTLTSGSWTIGANAATAAQEQAQYAPPNDHQCIRVALDSTSPGTVFSTRSTWNNFHIGTASEFVHDAVVGTDGYPVPPGSKQQQFDLQVSRRMTPACSDPAIIDRYPELKFSELLYTVQACRRTGSFLTINGTKYENCDNVGSFGYSIRHDGRVKEFKDELAGRGLEKSGHDNYRLTIPAGEKARLRTRVSSVDDERPDGHKRGLCGQAVKPAAGAILLFGLGIIGLVVYRPRNKGK